VLDTMVEMSMLSCGSRYDCFVSGSEVCYGLISCVFCICNLIRYIDMAETLCQKRALEAFGLDPTQWGGT